MNIFKSKLPQLNIGKDKLAEIVAKEISISSNTLDFDVLIDKIGQHVVAGNVGFVSKPGIEYSAALHNGDRIRIREIIWDWIVLRHLTLGDHNHDNWPHLTVTDSGVTYFKQR